MSDIRANREEIGLCSIADSYAIQIPNSPLSHHTTSVCSTDQGWPNTDVSNRCPPRIDTSLLKSFVQSARRIAGRDATSPFSLEDVYAVASDLELSGVLFLEKSDETRHVTVLLDLDDGQVVLYDPSSGVKVKDCDDTRLGMYAKPVGSLRDEFKEYERRAAPAKCSDVWAKYAQRGELLKRFLRHHSRFQHLSSVDTLHDIAALGLPAMQHKFRHTGCAPLSLFMISLLPSGPERKSHMSARKSASVMSGTAYQLINIHGEGETTQERTMVIQIFVTGGTFDKEYDEIAGSLVFKNTHIQEVLRLGRCKQEVDTRTLMMIDSLEMTETERQIILENCRECKRDRIVITHGTDSMEVTARVLGRAIKDKTIVLTGAMVPYKFGSSDGLFNLGSALAFVQSLPHGVYVAMNGRCFSWNRVQKNRETGEFEEIASAFQISVT
jgi:L-asparaginase